MRPALILIAVTAVLALVLVLLLARPSGDGLDRFPHAFLAAPGYEPAAVEIVLGPITSPPPPPAGLLPAWRCNDPAFADATGRPWLFPLPPGQVPPRPPRHPGLGKAPDIDQCQPYQTPEGAAQLAAFAARVAR